MSRMIKKQVYLQQTLYTVKIVVLKMNVFADGYLVTGAL